MNAADRERILRATASAAARRPSNRVPDSTRTTRFSRVSNEDEAEEYPMLEAVAQTEQVAPKKEEAPKKVEASEDSVPPTRDRVNEA